ncbi:MAG TPA: hypothetical protein PLP71_04615 [Syntrophomonadaceae bacterium]|nr:hypothetical protein [Syntrophomonadaceae bacterium]
MTDGKNFVDKIGLAGLLNLDEMVAEDEAKRKQLNHKKNKSKK